MIERESFKITPRLFWALMRHAPLELQATVITYSPGLVMDMADEYAGRFCHQGEANRQSEGEA